MSGHDRGNITRLLLQRERGMMKGRNFSVGQTCGNSSKQLGSWAEQDFMQHCSSSYVEFKPAPRSTIAAAFSPNGRLLASTHGDHTIKIVDCSSGQSIKVLEGHTRTPWVVRFHPLDSDMFASGSLDHRVVIWRISSGEKVFTHDFGKPIASIAFHPSGKALIVASGHKVYFWDYSKPASQTRPHQNPSYILRTKRSLRALHFHPLGIPLVLTAEVVDNKRNVGGADSSSAAGDPQPTAGVAIQQQQWARQEVPVGRTAAVAATSGNEEASVSASASASALQAHRRAFLDTVSHPANRVWRPPQNYSVATNALARVVQAASEAEATGDGGGGNVNSLGRSLSNMARSILEMAGVRLPGLMPRVLRGGSGDAASAGASPGPQQQQQQEDGGDYVWSPDATALRQHLSMLALTTFVAGQPVRASQEGPDDNILRRDLIRLGFVNPEDWVPSAPQPAAGQAEGPLVQVLAVNRQPAAAPILPAQRHQDGLGLNTVYPANWGARHWRAPPNNSVPTDALAQALGLHAASEAAAAATAPTAAPLPQNIAAAAAAQGQIAAVASAAAAAVSAMERFGSASNAADPLSAAWAAGPSAPFVDLAMCDPWGMQRIRSAGGMQTHVFPLEPQLLGPAYDLTWAWESHTSERSRSAPPHQNAMLESQLMPLAMVSEQPCIVNLNVWNFNHRRPTSTLDKARIQVPRAVLCSEMGAQFSPCGRYLAVCVSVDGELSEAAQTWLKSFVSLSGRRMRQAESIRESAMSRFRCGGATTACGGASSAAGPSTSAAGPSVRPTSSSSTCGGGSGGSDEPLSRIDMGDSFMVPVAQAWEVFPNDVHWLEFCNGTPQESVNEAVHQAREAAGLNKPLYELRIYSLTGSTFGQVLKARLIRAAHCLTSLQFSPTSEHLLVAYGRRFISLCNLVAEGTSLVPAHTVLEIYSTSDLQLVRSLPSLDDEVNVAAFHPVPGAGIVYGTKEGKLRSLKYDRRPPRRLAVPISIGEGRMDEELAEAERIDRGSQGGRSTDDDDDDDEEEAVALVSNRA